MRGRKTARKPRRKAVKVQVIPRPEKRSKNPECPYYHLDSMLKHHPHLSEARIAMAWALDVKANQDGIMMLGKCKKQTDLDRELRDYDFVIFLNATTWKQFDERQRAALVDHELCHAGLAEDKKTGDPLMDERGRRVYRIKKHEIEEFRGVIERHGLYKRDLQLFAKTINEAPLFPEINPPTPIPPANANEQKIPEAAEPPSNGKVNGHDHANIDETWRTVPIEEALQGLGSRAYDGFEAKNIKTMGDFSDFQAKHGDWWAKEIPGVGPETAGKIADAAEEFWASRKQPAAV